MLQNVKNFVKSFIMAAAAIFCSYKNNLQDKWERFPPQITGQKSKIKKLHVFHRNDKNSYQTFYEW